MNFIIRLMTQAVCVCVCVCVLGYRLQTRNFFSFCSSFLVNLSNPLIYCGVLINRQVCDIVVREFEIQSRYYFAFGLIFLRKA